MRESADHFFCYQQQRTFDVGFEPEDMVCIGWSAAQFSAEGVRVHRNVAGSDFSLRAGLGCGFDAALVKWE